MLNPKVINLLPRDQEKEVHYERLVYQLRNFWIWVIASLLLFYLFGFGAKTYLNQNIAGIEREIETKKQSLKSTDIQKLQQQVVALNTQINTIHSLRQQHYYWSNGLIELSNLIPSDMVVDLLTLDRSKGKIDISGTAGSRESVLKFWADMHQAKYFKNINFPLSNLEKALDTPYNYTFNIKEEEIKKE